MTKRKDSTNTAKYGKMYAKLSWKDKRAFHKKLKDESAKKISKGRIKNSTNRPLWSIERDQLIRENLKRPTDTLLKMIEKKFGTHRTPIEPYFRIIRSQIRLGRR